MSMPMSMGNSAWLDWMENLLGASRQSYAATFPPDRFYCLLDELPLHLIPGRKRRKQALGFTTATSGGESRLIVNPRCTFTSGGQLPEELSSLGELLSGFALQGTIAWVRDAVSDSLQPFWLGPKLEAAMKRVREDEAASSALAQDVRELLVQAGVLISGDLTSEDRAACRKREWQSATEKAGALFLDRGYAPLAGLIHPFHVAALRRYYRCLIRNGAIQLGDGQSSRRYVAYNEPVARFFHHQIAATLSAVAGEPLKPSYVYLASYLEGAELKRHTDREQCEFSVTLCLDFSPEPALETPWPIRLKTPAGETTIYQAIGDGLAYRGTRLPHYRDVLGKGQTSTSIFFHYVSADFTGSLS